MEEAIAYIFNVIITFMGFIVVMLVMAPALGGAILWFFIGLIWYWGRLQKSTNKMAWLLYYLIPMLYIIVGVLYIGAAIEDRAILGSFLNSLSIFIAHWCAMKVAKRYQPFKQ